MNGSSRSLLSPLCPYFVYEMTFVNLDKLTDDPKKSTMPETYENIGKEDGRRRKRIMVNEN